MIHRALLSLVLLPTVVMAEVDRDTERPERSWKPVAWGKVVQVPCRYQPGVDYSTIRQVRCPWYPIYYSRLRSDSMCPVGCECLSEEVFMFSVCLDYTRLNNPPASILHFERK